MARDFGFRPYDGGSEKYGFVSYKSEEYQIVAKYARALVDKGLNLWYDEGIPLGEKWDEVISEHIVGAAFMFVFVTNSVFISTEIKKEIHGAEENKIPVIPVFIEEIESVPAKQILFFQELVAKQGVTAYELSDENAVADRLCKKLGELGILTRTEQEARERKLREQEEAKQRLEKQKQEIAERERLLREQEAELKEREKSLIDYSSINELIDYSSIYKYKITDGKMIITGLVDKNAKKIGYTCYDREYIRHFYWRESI